MERNVGSFLLEKL